jgi:hypothetical protein
MPAVAHELREQEERRRRRPHERALGVVDHLGEHLGDVATRDHDLVVLRAERASPSRAGSGSRRTRVLEAQREGGEALAPSPRARGPRRASCRGLRTGSSPRGRRRAPCAGASPRWSASRTAPSGVVDRSLRARPCHPSSGKRSRAKARSARAVAAQLVGAHVPGRQLFDALEDRARRDHRPEREGLIEAHRIEGPRDRRDPPRRSPSPRSPK